MRVPKEYLPFGSHGHRPKYTAAVTKLESGGHVSSGGSWSDIAHCVLLIVMLLLGGCAVVIVLFGIDAHSSSFGYFDAVQPNTLCQDYPIGSISLRAFPESDWLPLNGQTLLKADYPELHARYCALESAECTDITLVIPNLTNTAIVSHGTLRADARLLKNVPAHKHDYTVGFVESTPTCDHEHTIKNSEIQSASWVHTHDVGATVRTGQSGAHRHGFITNEGRDYKDICGGSSPDPYSCRSKRHTTWEGGHRHEYFKYDTTPVVKSSPFVFKNAESCSADADMTSLMQKLWAVLDFAVQNFASPKLTKLYGNAMSNLDLFLLATGSCEDCGLAKASGVCNTGKVTAHNGGYINTDVVNTANCYPTPDVVNQPEGFSNVASTKQWLRGHSMRYDKRLRELNTTHSNSTFTRDMSSVITLMQAHEKSLRTIAGVFNGTTALSDMPSAVHRAIRLDTILESSVHRAIVTASPRRRLVDDRGEGDNQLDYTCENQYPTERNCARLEEFGGRFVESCKIFEMGSRERIWSDDWAEGCIDFDGYERDCFASGRGTSSIDSNPTKSITGVHLLTGCGSNDECCAEFDNRDCIAGGAPTDAWGTPTWNPLQSSDQSNPGCTSNMCCKRWGKLQTCNEVSNHVCCGIVHDCTHNALALDAGITGNDCCKKYSKKDGEECLQWNSVTFSCDGATECGTEEGCAEWNYADTTCATFNTIVISCDGATECGTEEGCAEWNYADTTCATFNTKEVSCEGRFDCGDWGCAEWNYWGSIRTTCKRFNTKQVSCEGRLDCGNWGCAAWNNVRTTCKRFNDKTISCEGRLDCGDWGCAAWNKMRTTCKRFNDKTISCQSSTRCPLPKEGGCKIWNQVNDQCIEWHTCEALELCAEPDTCVFDGCKTPDKCFVRMGCKEWDRMQRRAMACGCEECWPVEGNEWRYTLDGVGQAYGTAADNTIQAVDAFGTAFGECMQDPYSNVFSCAIEAGETASNSMEAGGYGCRAGSAVISDMHVEESNVGAIMPNHDLLTYMDEWMFAPHYNFDQATDEERVWPKDSGPVAHDGTEYYASTRDGNTGCPLNRCVWEIDVKNGANEYACRLITQKPGDGRELTLCKDQNGNRVHYRVDDGRNFECTAPNSPVQEDVGSGTPQTVWLQHPLHDTLYPYCHSYGAPSAWDDIRMSHDEKLQQFNQNPDLDLKNEDFKTRHTHSCEGEIQAHPWYHKHDITGHCDAMQPSGTHTHTAAGKTDLWSAQEDCVHKHTGQVRVLSENDKIQLPLDTTPPYVQHPHYIRVKGCALY